MFLTVLLVVIAVIVLLVLWLAGTYNRFVKLRNKTDEAFSAMDVSLKKRCDLLPNYVETVKGYAKHERETLDAVMAARTGAMNAGDSRERLQGERAVGSGLERIFALAEAYPELKANEQFAELQRQLQRTEEEIAGARRYYNGVVNKYNTGIEMFPGNLLAGMFGFVKKPLFEVDEAGEREQVKVSF